MENRMAIDILKAKQTFKEYVKNYNPEDEKIKIKIGHIERVSQIAKKLAENLNLDQEDIELSELIGLLHDIGRFEQAKRFNTFIDKDSINHGEYGVKVLFDDSWALVRASNTGPNLTARFEASTKERLESIQKEFTDLINELNK